MATIRKRNEKWQVLIRRKGIKHISKSFHLKHDAEKWARYHEAKADRGDLPIDPKELERVTLGDILRRYKKTVAVKKRSRDVETYIINALLRRDIASLSLKELTPNHLSAYRDERLEEVQACSFNREFAIVNHALQTAINEWDIPLSVNPAAKVRKPKNEASRTRRLDKDEITAIRSGLTDTLNPYIEPVIFFALETAMRQGEILRIAWRDVNFDNRTLHIPKTKNGHPRTIPLTSKAIDILKEHREMSVDDSDSVFPITAESLKQCWKRLLKRADIKDLHFHDLRHEAISRFFEMGLSMPEVALISGHKDHRMLLKYVHLRPEDVLKKLEIN